MTPKFKRILLKLSGETLGGEQGTGFEYDTIRALADSVVAVHNLGLEVGIVVGGGNIFRGSKSAEGNVGRVAGDHMGMLATVINAIALGEAINSLGSETRTMSAIEMNRIAEPYIRGRAMSHIRRNRIVLLGAGTGNPYFSTDTAATLRAMELNADVLLKATKVDGVFALDPEKKPSSKPFTRITYQEGSSD